MLSDEQLLRYSRQIGLCRIVEVEIGRRFSRVAGEGLNAQR
ncbi:hypothetical protein [Marinobacterium nitratireducens]|nr:hypothetical protein [Marinobacterium nitratireducens]